MSMRDRADVRWSAAILRFMQPYPAGSNKVPALVMRCALRSAQAYVLRAFVLHADDNQATIA
ncbi:UNVERIFIED_ORG: hypothetical protein ABIB63_001409 [Xanthomonas axonopodis]